MISCWVMCLLGSWSREMAQPSWRSQSGSCCLLKVLHGMMADGHKKARLRKKSPVWLQGVESGSGSGGGKCKYGLGQGRDRDWRQVGRREQSAEKDFLWRKDVPYRREQI